MGLKGTVLVAVRGLMGGEIWRGWEPLGTRITFHITDPSDMTRDLLKPNLISHLTVLDMYECGIPELEFELGMAVLGGKFTTLEGMLKDIRETGDQEPFTRGDSSNPGQREETGEFRSELDQILDGDMKGPLFYG
ncbi:Zinc finger protein ZPR1 [Camelus dromedarius]|uniref:Zinc finger protein ZPR1 n=1 Tax=Camelus dromedarius TaxID=9838 RepID=A0A5N4C7J1_CAMDR|nr:Zinc finger protein ZPR1 [Camelus dromedarius]